MTDRDLTRGLLPSRIPSGPIPRIEPQWAHQQFLKGARPETAMISIRHAQQLVKRDQTATKFFPAETDVITTTTISDDDLDEIDRDTECQILTDFQPDYHIPADHPVYGWMDDDHREENIKYTHSGTWHIYTHLQDHANEFRGDPPTLIPLIKTVDDQLIEAFLDLAEKIEAPCAAFYGAQYLTNGLQVAPLVEELTEIHQTIPNDIPLLFIGTLNPNLLLRLPHSVVAAAGLNAWRTRVKPRENSLVRIGSEYEDLAEQVRVILEVDPEAEEEDQKAALKRRNSEDAPSTSSATIDLED